MDFAQDTIREEAAAWFVRRREGVRTRSEEAAFAAWCRRSDAHARHYAETERAWEQWKQLQSSAYMRELTAAVMTATAPGRRRVANRRWRVLLAAASLAAVTMFGDMWLPPLMTPVSPLITSSSLMIYSTSLGERRTEQLPDGTRIVLDTQTAVEVRYSRRQREVILQHGEVMFEVMHDAARPFFVVTAEGTVTDLGTRFQVRNEDGTTTVTLLQGLVEVAAHDHRRQLVPGEQARYGTNVPGIHVRQVDPATVTNWLHGRLDFSGLPLSQVVAEANRYSAVKLRVDDPGLASLAVGGSFRAGDNVAIANALSAVFPVRVVPRNAHEIVLMPR